MADKGMSTPFSIRLYPMVVPRMLLQSTLPTYSEKAIPTLAPSIKCSLNLYPFVMVIPTL